MFGFGEGVLKHELSAEVLDWLGFNWNWSNPNDLHCVSAQKEISEDGSENLRNKKATAWNLGKEVTKTVISFCFTFAPTKD